MRALVLRPVFRFTIAAVAVAAVALLCAGRTPAAADATPAAILSAFNSERTANGLPAITEVPEWSRSCGLHNHYQAVNRILGHIEDPSRPAYTVDGAWAGAHAVLAPESRWVLADPWLNAPIHLNQMMSPSLVQAGFAESEQYNCFTTFAGYSDTSPWRTSTEPDRIWSFPGQGQTMPYAQTANESPHTPGEWVGIPQGTRTGPYLLVYWTGPRGDPEPGDSTYDPNTRVETNPTPPVAPLSLLTTATVSGPEGAVEVRVLNTATHQEDGYYIAPDSGFVLPVRPLRPNITYTVSATFAASPESDQPARSYSGAFTFRTNRAAYRANGPTDGPRGLDVLPLLSSAKTNQRMRLRTVRSRSGRVTLRLALTMPASVAAKATARSRVLATQPARMLPVGPSSISLKLSLSKLRAALGRRRSITVSVRIRANDGAGTPDEARTLQLTVVR